MREGLLRGRRGQAQIRTRKWGALKLRVFTRSALYSPPRPRALLELFLPFISGKATGGEFPFSVCFDSVVFLKRGRKTIITFSVL